MVDSMFRGSRAPRGRSRSGDFGFSGQICFGEAPEQRFSDRVKREDRRAAFARRSPLGLVLEPVGSAGLVDLGCGPNGQAGGLDKPVHGGPHRR